MDKKKIIDELSSFVSIQSVSADPSCFSEIEKAVVYLTDKLNSLGFIVDIIKEATSQSPPLLVAYKEVSPKAKTIGIYGHYDVQPEDPVDEWHTTPFSLTLKNGKLYARGVADNKGHLWQNITAIEQLMKEGRLGNNIVFIFEGEEESGSVNFKQLVEKATKVISKSDVFYVTDENMFKKNIPQIGYGLRGLLYFEITVTIGNRDLHSGVYGNRVYNPINVLSDLLAKMKDIKTGKIMIPGYYEKVRKSTDKELEQLKKIRKSENEEKAESQAYTFTGVEGVPDYVSALISPSLDAHGIIGGYVGEGAKTVIPKTATMKFSSRLVEYQDPDECEKMIRNFIQETIPQGVTYELKLLGKDAPFYTQINNEWVKKTANVFNEVFGNETVFSRSGGSIPAAEILSNLFQKSIILTGFTLPDDNIHAPNENYDEEMFWKGIEALKAVYSL